MGHPALTFPGLTSAQIEHCVRTLLKQRPTAEFQKLHIASVYPQTFRCTKNGEILDVRTLQLGNWDIDEDADAVLVLARTFNGIDAHSVCLFADYTPRQLYYLDSMSPCMPKWLEEVLSQLLPCYTEFEHNGLRHRQQYQPATCGVWTLANAARLAHGQKPATPANLAESNAFLEKWLRFVVKETAVT